MIEERSMEEEEDVCRVCLEESPLGLLSLPCKCKNGLRLIHSECLSIWAGMKPISSVRNEEYFEC